MMQASFVLVKGLRHIHNMSIFAVSMIESADFAASIRFPAVSNPNPSNIIDGLGAFSLVNCAVQSTAEWNTDIFDAACDLGADAMIFSLDGIGSVFAAFKVIKLFPVSAARISAMISSIRARPLFRSHMRKSTSTIARRPTQTCSRG